MQHKRNPPVKGILAATTLIVLLGAAVLLIAKPIPAPQQPIEKKLDSDAMLNQKAN